MGHGGRQSEPRTIDGIADEGQLADSWDVETAATLAYVLTLPRIWDELVVNGAWSSERYVEQLTALLRAAFVLAAPE